MKTIIKLGLAGVVLVTLLAGVFAWYRLNHLVVTVPGPAPLYTPLDLPRPDALIVTQSFSQIPRAVLTVPLLKELLSEDFVFYYEQTEDRLDLAGTLRRIAYEHELNLRDEILAYVFNTPAHIALWKGHDGALKHYLMLIDRGGLIKALETVSKIVLDDEQLKVRGEIALADGARLTVYELEYGYRRSLFFADYHGYLLVFSDAGLLLPTAPEKQAEVAKFLTRARPYELFLERFKLSDAPHPHTLAVSAEYLSFGYQRFFPAIEALRFDITPAGWSTAALLIGALPASGALWNAVPTAPALCAALPVDTATLVEMLRQVMPGEEGQQLLQALTPPAAVCWYRRSRLYTPLVLIKLGKSKTSTALVRTLFEKTVGSLEAGIPTPAPEPRKIYHPPFAVSERNCSDGMIWRREVSSRYGLYNAETSPDAESMRSPRFFAVTLAYCNQMLLFSPDDTLVNNAVAVLARQYPALSDSLPRGDLAAVVFPESLSDLIAAELLESLPDAQEPVFRASVSRYLIPQLEKIKQFPAYALELPTGKTGWVPMQWKELAAH